MKLMSLRRLWAASFIFAGLFVSMCTPTHCMEDLAERRRVLPLAVGELARQRANQARQKANQAAFNACIEEWKSRDANRRRAVDASALGQENCTMCQAPFINDEKRHRYVALPCREHVPHVFHQDCIQPYFTQLRVCPLCQHQAPAQELEACGAVNRQLIGYEAILELLRDTAAANAYVSAVQNLGIHTQLDRLEDHPPAPINIPVFELRRNTHIADVSARTLSTVARYAFTKPDIETRRLFALSGEFLANANRAGWGHLMALQFSRDIVAQITAGKPAPVGALDAVHVLFQNLNLLNEGELQRLAQGNEALDIINTASSIALAVPAPTSSLAADFVINLAYHCLSNQQIAPLLANSNQFERFIASPLFSTLCQNQLSNPETIQRTLRQLGRLGEAYTQAVWEAFRSLDNATWGIITGYVNGWNAATGLIYYLASIASNAAAEIKAAIWQKLDTLAQEAWNNITDRLDDVAVARNFMACLAKLADGTDEHTKATIWNRLQALPAERWTQLTQNLYNQAFTRNFLRCFANLAKHSNAEIKTAIYDLLRALRQESWGQIAANLGDQAIACNLLGCLADLGSAVNIDRRVSIWKRLNALGNDGWTRIAQNLGDHTVASGLVRCLAALTDADNERMNTAILRRLNALGDDAWARITQNIGDQATVKDFLHLLSNLAYGANAQVKAYVWNRLNALGEGAWNQIAQNFGGQAEAGRLVRFLANLTNEANAQVNTAIWNRLNALGDDWWARIAQHLHILGFAVTPFLRCLANLANTADAQVNAAIWNRLNALGDEAWHHIAQRLVSNTNATSFLHCLTNLANTGDAQIKTAIWNRLNALGGGGWVILEGHLRDENLANQLIMLLTAFTAGTSPVISAAAEEKLQDIGAKIALAQQ